MTTKYFKTQPGRLAKTLSLVTIFAIATSSCASQDRPFGERIVGVELTGVHHMGPSFKVDKFYVNTTYGGNVGFEGGGGRITCCVDLPSTWRPGLTVTVRWGVSDWSHENMAETDIGNYRSVLPGGRYRAQIPVEKYDDAEHVYVHFFAGGRARVVASMAGPGKYHPIAEDDPHAVELATAGTRVAQLFTEEELAEMRRKADADRKRFGDWR